MHAVIKRLSLAALVVALLAVLAPSVSALECEGVPLDGGCLFTITGGDTDDPDDGFAVTNADDVPLWDFVAERDLQAIGYPISQRWVNGPFTLQAFQKVILQWEPGQQRMNYYNTLDVLANRYPEVELPNVPPHLVLQADQGADFATITRNHLALLDQNAAIKARFLSEPDWLNLYGLPIRYEEREVNDHPQGLQMLRAQRTVFVIWNVPAPGTTVGRVNLQNVPDKVKKLSNVIIPDRVKRPLPKPDPAVVAAIHALPWAMDGVSPLEGRVIQRLQTIAAISEPLFWYLLTDLDMGPYIHALGDPVRTQPTPATLTTYDAIIHIAGLTWIHDELTTDARDIVTSLHRNAFIWPRFIQALLQKPWMTDGLSRAEIHVIKWLHFTLENSDTLYRYIGPDSPWDQPLRRRREAANLGVDILAMPFLETIDGFEKHALSQIRYAYGMDFKALRRKLSRTSHRKAGLRMCRRYAFYIQA